MHQTLQQRLSVHDDWLSWNLLLLTRPADLTYRNNALFSCIMKFTDVNNALNEVLTVALSICT